MTDDRLTESKAAAELGVEPETLRRWRAQGDAPPHDTDNEGAVCYRRDELVAWREHYVHPPGEVDNAKGAT